MVKNTLTSYEIAQYAQVTPRTVIQWINEGKLKAYRTPGNHSRVTIKDLLDFLNKYQMPVSKELMAKQGEDRKRILIVDDDKGAVDAIRRLIIRQRVYDLEIAYDGFEAVEKFVSFKPHMIILDIKIPRLDGYKVCSCIRSNPDNKNVKIFFISGSTDLDTVSRVAQSGANGYLAKPFEIQQIISLIEQKGKLR